MGRFDNIHGDEHLVECHRDCEDYCECAAIDADQKAEDDFELYREQEF